ncbi:MAG: 4Fe-4S binding protein [Spirochaetaceae bacterium]|jgi:iron only hydrogenase large subunit-like protein|nr:4Fe-4S binding protein [Spirochaetaceae bacterium]
MTDLIKVDTDKCNNCHSCISVCPVKNCVDGSGNKIAIIADRCLGCGRCVHVCASHARAINDDTEAFVDELDNHKPLVVMIAPAAVTVFDDIFRLISFLKSSGVLAVFDVSFGAELSARSYLEYARRENPETIIAQPCPAIVNYCELYAPRLIQYLAPVHSPMMHTAIMIRNYFPDFAGAKIAALSPCVAKKREFEETGYVDFNVTLIRFKEILEQRHVDLNEFTPHDFDGPMSERAVSFSSPGGLKNTIVRDAPALSSKIRRIEGTFTVYKYLNDIPQMLEEGVAPLLIDCLSCSAGCNGGPGTGNFGHPVAMLENKVDARLKMQIHRNKMIFGINRIKSEVNNYWKQGLYDRVYKDCSENLAGYRKPTQKDLDIIYHKMKKTTKADFLNCAACGYGDCRSMAEAIFNKLNRPENCHHYLKKEIDERLKEHQSILQYVRDGIFLLESNGRILPSYSKALEEIFRRDMLADVSIMSIFSGFFDKEKLKEIDVFMDRVFDASVPDGELQKENPLRNVEARFANLDGGFDIRRLNFAIERIYDGKTVSKLLVIVRDGGAFNSGNAVCGSTAGGEADAPALEASGRLLDDAAIKPDKSENNFNRLVKNNEMKAVMFALAEKLLFCSADGSAEDGKDNCITFDACSKDGEVCVSCHSNAGGIDVNKVMAQALAFGFITAEEAEKLSEQEKLDYFFKVCFSGIKDRLKALSCLKIKFSNKSDSCRLNLIFPVESAGQNHFSVSSDCSRPQP